MVFPGHTLLHFGHFLFITIRINQFFCVSCLTFCQCTQTVIFFSLVIAIADLFLVEYVRFRKPMTPNLQADVHFRDALEHLHLLDMHIVLHKQLTGCMHTNVIASKHFQTTSSQSVPSCHKSIVSVSLFSRSTITWST